MIITVLLTIVATLILERLMKRSVLRQRKVPISREGFLHGFDHEVD